MRLLKASSITLALLLAPGLLSAQDLTGLWDITASFTFPANVGQAAAAVPDCEYSGKGINLVQQGNKVSGTLNLNLDKGGDCPGQMAGTLSADVMGSSFSGILTGSSQNLGTATVQGTIGGAQPRASAAAAAATTMMGLAAVRGGSFDQSTGSFGGQQLPATPTMGPAAIAVLALILFGGTVFLLMRRQRVSV